ncbi:hypothetical protein RB195_003343 [Necator americanus]|uniref:Protein kinase domain-containing protein n=1 Tax=Necator americanus TaxID=51031 RepID=A0ABR1DN43_NECAM
MYWNTFLRLLNNSKDNTCSQSMEHSKSKSAGRRSGSKERRRKLDKVKKKRRKNVKEKSQRIDRSIEREEKSTTKSFQSQEQEFPPEDRKSQVQVDCIEIEGVIYFKGRKLAKGGSGSVWHVTRKDNGMKFALKEASLKRNGAIYRGEVERLQALSGAPHIIALVAHDFLSSEMILRMVLELGEIDLECEMKQKGKFDKETTRSFALQIAKGIKEMHDRSILHLDMKLANVVVIQGVLKIIDLGLSATLSDKEDFIIRNFMFGSNRPPEQIVPQSDGTYKLTKKVDIWGFGIVVYQMTYGRRPFTEHPEKTMMAILDPNVRIQHDIGADPVITEFLEMCTVREVEKRATIDQLLEHQYLAEVATPQRVFTPGPRGTAGISTIKKSCVTASAESDASRVPPTASLEACSVGECPTQEQI